MNKQFLLPPIHKSTYLYYVNKNKTNNNNSRRKAESIRNQDIGRQVLIEMSEPRKDQYRLMSGEVIITRQKHEYLLLLNRNEYYFSF